jgi:hypothetical protein
MTQPTTKPVPDGNGHDQAPEPGASSLARAVAWFRHAPAERAPLAGIPAVWTAAEILHAAAVTPVLAGAATVAAAGLAFGLGERRQPRRPAAGPAADGGDGQDPAPAGSTPDLDHPRMRGAELAAATGGVGAWATMAAIWGPTAGPYGLLTWVYAAGMGGGYWWMWRHEALRGARARRDAAAAAAADAAAREAAWLAKRIEWHHLAARPAVGMHGSHLMAIEPNLNGEVWTVDTYSTGKLASQIDARQLAQRLAGERGVPKGRVEVTDDSDWPYRLHILFRAGDPWKGGSADAFIWHPSASGAYDPAAPFADLAPPVASVLDPVTLGVDPETGQPLQVPLFTGNGAQRILIVATSGSGKSMLLDTIRERVTACQDARLLQINLSKGVEDSWWEPLTEASALASHPDPAARALAILDYLTAVIKNRLNAPARKAGARSHQPTPAEPALVLVIDEYDEVSRDRDRRAAVESIASKCRSEGIPLILATQRPAGKWVSTSIKANISQLVWSKMRDSDARHAAGSDGFALPDMGAYGGANPGIFGVCAHPTFPGMPFQRGRAFFWGNTSDGLLRLISSRAAARQPHTPEPVLAGLAGQWEAITGGALPPGDDGRYDLAVTRDGTTVPGTTAVRGRLAAVAGILATPPPATGGPAGDGPPAGGTDDKAALATLRALVARPGGVSVREAADALPYQKTKAHELLGALVADGYALPPGKGPAARYYAAPPPAATATGDGPRLRAVPDPDGYDGQADQDAS